MRPDVTYNLFWNATSTHIMWLYLLPYGILFIVPSLCGFICIQWVGITFFYICETVVPSVSLYGRVGWLVEKITKWLSSDINTPLIRWAVLECCSTGQSILAGQEIEYIIRIQLQEPFLNSHHIQRPLFRIVAILYSNRNTYSVYTSPVEVFHVAESVSAVYPQHCVVKLLLMKKQ
jgi:hypothetical protein